MPNMNRLNRRQAVLMGDVIGSTDHPQKKLHHTFNEIVDGMNKRYSRLFISPLTITLGDEFQGLTRKLSEAALMAQLIRLRGLMSGVSMRFVIGEVIVESDVNPNKAWNMMGQGFAEAREKLNNKTNESAYRFSFIKDQDIEQLINAIGMSLTFIENDWTELQKKYVFEISSKPDTTKKQIAENAHISQNNLYKILRSASYSHYEDLFSAVESYLLKRDEKHA